MGDAAIRDDEELTAALKQIDALWLAERGSPEDDRLDALVREVVLFENFKYSIKI